MRAAIAFAHEKRLETDFLVGIEPLISFKCGRLDLNQHAIAGTRPSTWRVCQFRHDRISC